MKGNEAMAESDSMAMKRHMVAVTGDSANAASIRLHESLGFRRMGR